MSIITKLIGMIALGHTAAESRIAIQNFLTGLASVLVLALVSGLMIGSLLVGIHFIVYQLFLNYSTLTPLEAMAATLAIGLVITGAVIFATVQQLKHVFDLPKQLHVEEYQQPVSYRIAGIAEAFISGLTGRSASRF